MASLRSRDNARTAMQWNKDMYAGFSEVEPLMPLNRNYKKINVEDQIIDPNSLFNHYKKLIELRRFSQYSDVITYGSYEQLDLENPYIYIYKRKLNDQMLLIINSFSRKTIIYDLSAFDLNFVLISNYKNQKNETPQYYTKTVRIYCIRSKGEIMRRSGILCHISSLPSPYGIGSFGKKSL